jgi:hypothetical protein
MKRSLSIDAERLFVTSYEEAESAAEQALVYDPHYLTARYRRGIARKELNLLKAAMIGAQDVPLSALSSSNCASRL